MDSKIKIIKNRSDIGAGTRGSDLGIDALEIAAINRENSYFNDLPFDDVETYNETIYNKVKYPFAKRISYVLGQCKRVSKRVSVAMSEGFFPVVLSGDHSSALGTISGIKAAFPNKRLGVVWIDAHADLHSPYTSPSGNIHGMPLAAAIADDNLDCKVNELTEETRKHWPMMQQIGTPGQKVAPADIVYFGVRSTEPPEDHQIKKYNIKNFTVPEYRYKGGKNCLDAALSQLGKCDHIYISFDVDSLDCDRVSYGTGTPVPNGFNPDEVKEILNGLIASGKVCAMEVVEINPLLDTKGNVMAETAFEILHVATSAIRSSLK